VSRREKIVILKVYIFAWAGLAILTVWLNRWTASLGFGFISCVIGAMAATAQVDPEDPKRKEWKHTAIALMVFLSTNSRSRTLSADCSRMPQLVKIICL
jgi:hypothetical protein